MTPFVTMLISVLQAAGNDVKNLNAKIGNPANLNTVEKNHLVGALNEVLAAVQAITPGAAINDAAVNTTNTLSSTKITQLIATLKTEILGGASAAYDTLQEIQALMQADDTQMSSILTAVGNRIRFDAAQSLSDPQILQAAANMGLGDISTNLLTTYTTARDA